MTFQVTNKDSGRDRGRARSRSGRILGERENLSPGLCGTFSLELDGRDIQDLLPRRQRDRDVHSHRRPEAAATRRPGRRPARPGVDGYATYVKDQAAQLVTATKAFTDAVKAGDVAKAKELYGPARIFYERIEPVAESFGDLDPAIDIRVPDVADPEEWTGFHAIEQALWEKGRPTA